MKIRVFLVALLMLAPFAVYAEDVPQNYDVELLIFRPIRPTASAENWVLEPTAVQVAAHDAGDSEETPAVVPSPNASAPPITESTFAALATTQFKLNGLEESLRRGRTYLPVAHFGWTQPGFPLDNAPRFSMQSFLPGFLPDNIVLSGQTSLARGRYLHLLLDVTYQAPDGQRYVLREQRRMRSNEKHYFDHPYFGVIVVITPRTT